jgi:hypothetical protein
LALAEAGDDVERGLGAFAGLNPVIPLAALRGRQQARIAAHQLRKESETVRVIAHHEKIEGRESFTC